MFVASPGFVTALSLIDFASSCKALTLKHLEECFLKCVYMNSLGTWQVQGLQAYTNSTESARTSSAFTGGNKTNRN